MSLRLAVRRGGGWALKRFLFACTAHLPVDAVRVVAYHSIDDSGSMLSVSAREFRQHLELLRSVGCRVLSAAGYLARVPGRDASGAREVLLTFDDAYDNFYRTAAPLLSQFGYPAVVFVPTDFIGGRPEWFERDRQRIQAFVTRSHFSVGEVHDLDAMMRAAAGRRLMNGAEMRELAAAGFDFQSHGAAHHFLPLLNSREREADLMRSRRALADVLGRESRLLCYPYGACDDAVVEAARAAGFQAAFLARYPGEPRNPFALGRIATGGPLRVFDLRFSLSAAVDRYYALTRRVRTVDD